MNSGPAPPPAPSLPNPTSQGSLRTTYINLFNQILDNSININCICKTTQRINEKNLNQNSHSRQRYDHSDFMDDDEDNSDSADIEMRNIEEHEVREIQLNSLTLAQPPIVHLAETFGRKQYKKICDLSCFENLKYIHNVLKNCFNNSNDIDKAKGNFEEKWNSFKFLRDDPKSCDYYGTTIYHYASSDSNFELLKCIVSKYPRGVECLDSKGMTPLMRAAQRNNYKCVEFLLNDTSTELNGSIYSTYTPLWFGVSNGYVDLVKLLLDYNANPSINDSHKKSSNTYDDQTESSSDNNSFLFSPIRASIVYSQFKIMNYLLEYGANVNELFNIVTTKTKTPNDIRNENYINALKFFHRQFGQVVKLNENSDFLTSLNNFVEDPNVYMYMLIEFVKNVYINIKLNGDLTIRFEQFLNSFGKNSIDYIINMTQLLEKPSANKISIDEYLDLVNEFMCAIDQFISSEQIVTNENNDNVPVITNRREYNDFVRNLIQKPNHHKNLIEFVTFLLKTFHHPKSLKELARFSVRKQILQNIDASNLKYNSEFLKSNHMEQNIGSFGLPANLVNYLLHR